MTRKRSRTPKAVASLPFDDFKLIEGICPAVDSCLHNAGITTYAQLANLSPMSLSDLVPGLQAKREAREAWLKQAQHLAITQSIDQRRREATVRHGRHPTITVELQLNQDNTVQYTRVTHYRCDVEEHWPGWEESRLISFLVRHAGLAIAGSHPQYFIPSGASPETAASPVAMPQIEPASTAESPRAVPTALRAHALTPLDIDNTPRLSNLVTTLADSSVPCASIHVGKPFMARFELEFHDVAKSLRVPWDAVLTVWAKKLGENSQQVVGEERSVLTPVGKVPCTVEVMIPTQGIYRLEVVATLSRQGRVPSSSRVTTMERSSPLHVY